MRERSQIAVDAALAGAATIRERSGRLGETRTKTSSVDLVTETDIAAGVSIVRSVLKQLPRARFVVEEPQVYELADATLGNLHDSEVWVVDPIDGTTSYVHDYPFYSVSVACLAEGRPVAGAVYNLPFDEMFAAAEGHGATRNGLPIACSSEDRVAQALMVTGFPYDRGAPLDRQLEIFARAARQAQGIRRDGSAALDCCHIACGRADAFWELDLRPWDTAAGTVIVHESGALLTDFEGRAWSPETSDVVAANPVLHPIVLDMLLGRC